MIYLVTGVLGSGKTYYAVRRVAQALFEGKPVATNVALREDFAEYMVRHRPELYVRQLRRRQLLGEDERSLRGHYHFAEDLDELMSVRLAGRGESRGVMVLDEAHDWMNSRSWSAGDRSEIVRFFTRSRKLGWDVILIAQKPEMIDKQVRDLFEYSIQLRNLKKARYMGVPITLGINLFLAIWSWWAAGNRIVLKREAYRLTWVKDLYDTMAGVGLDLDVEDDSLVLPSPPASRPTRPTAAALAAAPGAPAVLPSGAASTRDAHLLDLVDPELRDPSL